MIKSPSPFKISMLQSSVISTIGQHWKLMAPIGYQWIYQMRQVYQNAHGLLKMPVLPTINQHQTICVISEFHQACQQSESINNDSPKKNRENQDGMKKLSHFLPNDVLQQSAVISTNQGGCCMLNQAYQVHNASFVQESPFGQVAQNSGKHFTQIALQLTIFVAHW